MDQEHGNQEGQGWMELTVKWFCTEALILWKLFIIFSFEVENPQTQLTYNLIYDRFLDHAGWRQVLSFCANGKRYATRNIVCGSNYPWCLARSKEYLMPLCAPDFIISRFISPISTLFKISPCLGTALLIRPLHNAGSSNWGAKLISVRHMPSVNMKLMAVCIFFRVWRSLTCNRPTIFEH